MRFAEGMILLQTAHVSTPASQACQHAARLKPDGLSAFQLFFSTRRELNYFSETL